MAKVNAYKPKLIIGLGNPDKKYENTYHNVGFLAVDYFAKNLLNSNLLKSAVFMNQSGDFVGKAIKKHGIKPQELMVIHDDSDIELGNYKISFGRSSAGHQGVESIINSLGTKNFWRLRIGIRKAGLPAETRRAKAGDFVLEKITKNDWEILEKTFSEIEL